MPLEFKTHRITDMQKAKVKKRVRRPWSEDEIKLLKRLFPSGRARKIAKRTGRTLAAVRQQAYNMGITHRHFWSADETELLKQLYPNESIRSIADKLGRTEQAVRYRARTIGLKKGTAPPWSNQEIALLKKMYPDNSKRDIANKLGRTLEAVVSRGGLLGLGKKPRLWSKRELNLLKKLYPSKTAQEIAEQLGRPVRATQTRIFKLDIKKRLRYKDRHRIVNGIREKSCSKCEKWIDESQFSKNRRGKDGLVGWCKECSRVAHKKRWLASKS